MKGRTLFCITVYNGRAFVPRAIRSVLRMAEADGSVDLLILDDASPEPGWSEELAGLCRELGVRYYCTPRNLGIPRNVNLGLRTAVVEGYDNVVIANSDIIVPLGLVAALKRGLDHPGDPVGSVTAWSNNVSIYSLANEAPDLHLNTQEIVDGIAGVVDDAFGGACIDIPAGISFSILIPTAMVREVGLMDPVYGRGYCEEIDWSLRARQGGFRNLLAIGTFVYHQGGGSNVSAGLLSEGHTTVPQNEAIIDLRYPMFRDQVHAFQSSQQIEKANLEAVRQILLDAVRSHGYVIEVTDMPVKAPEGGEVNCVVASDGRSARIEHRGFVWDETIPDANPVAHLESVLGSAPARVVVAARGRAADEVRSSVTDSRDAYVYPTRV